MILEIFFKLLFRIILNKFFWINKKYFKIIFFSYLILQFLILFLLGIYFYGNSLISKNNDEQVDILLKHKNLELMNEIIMVGFKNSWKCGCNSFCLRNGEILFINNLIRSVEDLKLLNHTKRNIPFFKMELSKKQELALMVMKISKVKDLKFGLNLETYDRLIKENSWSGYFYKKYGGYSILDTIKNVTDSLKDVSEKLDNGFVGSALIDEVAYMFFYDFYAAKIQIFKEIRAYKNKLSALEILINFLTLDILTEEE
ncbi:hypothetical protein DMUE_4812 [Dictyocoela muelleri]|nr:hypothetical protein DMUE_4812 [Dictyocoela muelleri]